MFRIPSLSSLVNLQKISKSKHEQVNNLLQDLKIRLNLNTEIHYHSGKLNTDKFISNCKAIAKDIKTITEIDSKNKDIIQSIEIDMYKNDLRNTEIQRGLTIIKNAIKKVNCSSNPLQTVLNAGAGIAQHRIPSYRPNLQTALNAGAGIVSTKENIDLDTLIEKLSDITEPKAQRDVAMAILEGKFGNDQTVLCAIAKKLHMFTDPEAQRDVAMAIQNGKFSDKKLLDIFYYNENVLNELIKNLDVFKDPEAQKTMAKVINDGYFGRYITFESYINVTNSDTLCAIAEKLHMFTDPEAQRDVAIAISRGKFGKDKKVLCAIAKKLRMFTDQTAREELSYALVLNLFGKDKEVLDELIENLDVFLKSAVGQQNVALAIAQGKFGDDEEVLKKLQSNLHMFTDPSAKIDIMKAMLLGKFGNDPKKLANLRPDQKSIIYGTFLKGWFGSDTRIIENVKHMFQ